MGAVSFAGGVIFELFLLPPDIYKTGPKNRRSILNLTRIRVDCPCQRGISVAGGTASYLSLPGWMAFMGEEEERRKREYNSILSRSSSPNVGTYPMSVRQQLAMIKQMEMPSPSGSTDSERPSTPSRKTKISKVGTVPAPLELVISRFIRRIIEERRRSTSWPGGVTLPIA